MMKFHPFFFFKKKGVFRFLFLLMFVNVYFRLQPKPTQFVLCEVNTAYDQFSTPRVPIEIEDGASCSPFVDFFLNRFPNKQFEYAFMLHNIQMVSTIFWRECCSCDCVSKYNELELFYRFAHFPASPLQFRTIFQLNYFA